MKKLLKRRLAGFPPLWVALALALAKMEGKGRVGNSPLKHQPLNLLCPQVKIIRSLYKGAVLSL